MLKGMKNHPKRSKYLIMLLLTMLNVIFRMPTIPNELGNDSFKIHSYANLISEEGFANWVIHPLSIFGMYPFSTPITVPFLQSGISQSTDLSMKFTILITSVIIGLIGMIMSYVMAKEIKNDDVFAFLVAFCYSLSPIFLSYTIWTTSSRHLFIALIPIFIWALLRCHNTPQKRWKYAILAIILFVILGAIHHVILLLVFVVISYIISMILKYIKIKIYLANSRTEMTIKSASYAYIIINMGFIVAQGLKLAVYKDFNIWWKYQNGTFFSGSDALTLIANMIVDYISKIGILSIFIIIGILIVLQNSNRDIYQNLLLITLLFFAPIMMIGTYVPLILLSFFSVLIAYGVLYLNEAKIIKKHNTNFVSICIIISTIFSIFMLSHWSILIQNQETEYLEQTTEDVGIYLKNYHVNDSSFVSNSDVRKISATSQVPYPPPDTAYIFNLVNESDLKINSSFSLSSITSLDNPDAIYKTNIDYRAEYGGQSRDIDSNLRKQYNLKYNIRYVVQDNQRLGKWFTNSPDAFYSSVTEKKSKVYDNNEFSVWYIEET